MVNVTSSVGVAISALESQLHFLQLESHRTHLRVISLEVHFSCAERNGLNLSPETHPSLRYWN